MNFNPSFENTCDINYQDNEYAAYQNASNRMFAMLSTGFFSRIYAGNYGGYNNPGANDRLRLLGDALTLKEAALLATVNFMSSIDDIVAMRNALTKVIEILSKPETCSNPPTTDYLSWGQQRNVDDSRYAAKRTPVSPYGVYIGDDLEHAPHITTAVHTDPNPVVSTAIRSNTNDQTSVNPGNNTAKNNDDDTQYFGAGSAGYGISDVNQIVSGIFDSVHRFNEETVESATPAAPDTAISTDATAKESVN